MKGMVFVELLKMAEESFGEELVDAVLDAADLPSGGAYTAVGNYPCAELIALVEGFAARSGLGAEALQRSFGHWMMQQFGKGYPQFFEDKSTAFELLEAVEDEVHVEVRKLYPEAELPRFATRRTGAGEMEMHYSSQRPLGAFCHGLIEASLAHFGEAGEVVAAQAPEGAREVVFRVRVDVGADRAS